MRLSFTVSCILSLVLPLMATSAVGLTGGDATTAFNQEFLKTRELKAAKPTPREVVVFPGDRVIPQFVDGSGWKTSITVINLENRLVNFQVLFFQDDGRDLIVPVVGQGNVRGMNITTSVR